VHGLWRIASCFLAALVAVLPAGVRAGNSSPGNQLAWVAQGKLLMGFVDGRYSSLSVHGAFRNAVGAYGRSGPTDSTLCRSPS
jgi:hypothetical protein